MKICIETEVFSCKECLMARSIYGHGGDFLSCSLTDRYIPEEGISKYCPFNKENAESGKNE